MIEQEIFLAAVDKEDSSEQAVYLDQACGGDEALRQRVEALLRSHTGAHSFLQVPALAQVAAAAPAGRPDETQAEVWNADILPNLKKGAVVAFSHGFNIRYSQINPPARRATGEVVDVITPRAGGIVALSEDRPSCLA